jgi:hypothetical protein
VFIFRHDIFDKYEFVWKFDADASFLEKPLYDLFKVMRSFRYDFSYYVKSHTSELPQCHKFVPQFFENYRQSHDLEWKHSVQERTIYWGFSWIISSRLVRSEEFQSIINEVDASGNVYSKRWDSQNLLPSIIALLCEQKKVYWHGGIRLRHQGLPLPQK